MAATIKIDQILNLSGLLCPTPAMITEKRLEGMLPGETLEVLCTDKKARESIPDLCRRGNYKLLASREEEGVIHFMVRK